MGGGTDLPSFYCEEEGMVLSTTINKFMYITVNNRFDSTYRISYSQTEIVDNFEQIQHPIFRTVLKKHVPVSGQGLEIVSMSDIPAGTGLGSSSSFTVGLLHAIKGHQGIFQSPEDLANEACQIEIFDLKEPIGKQDQYAAAFGGLQTIRFLPTGEVSTEPVVCSQSTYRELEATTMLFYTGITRSASKVMIERNESIATRRDALRETREAAKLMARLLEQGKSMREFGAVLQEGWRIKKIMGSGISNPKIDEWYECGMRAGAYGGKIIGAGGGGFAHPFPMQKPVDPVSGRSVAFPLNDSGSHAHWSRCSVRTGLTRSWACSAGSRVARGSTAGFRFSGRGHVKREPVSRKRGKSRTTITIHGSRSTCDTPSRSSWKTNSAC